MSKTEMILCQPVIGVNMFKIVSSNLIIIVGAEIVVGMFIIPKQETETVIFMMSDHIAGTFGIKLLTKVMEEH